MIVIGSMAAIMGGYMGATDVLADIDVVVTPAEMRIIIAHVPAYFLGESPLAGRWNLLRRDGPRIEIDSRDTLANRLLRNMSDNKVGKLMGLDCSYCSATTTYVLQSAARAWTHKYDASIEAHKGLVLNPEQLALYNAKVADNTVVYKRV